MLYRRLELTLYGIVLTVSLGVGAMTERLDYWNEKNTLSSKVSFANQSFAFGIESAIFELIAWANGMASVVALNPNIDHRGFGAAAARLGTDESVILNISLATDNVVRRVFPLERNALLLGRDLRLIDNHTEGITLAQRSGAPVLIGPLDLVQGVQGLILRYAFASVSEESDALNRRQMISIVVDSKRFFDKIARDTGIEEVHTTVSRAGDDTTIHGGQSILWQDPIISTLATPSGNWTIASAPASGWPKLSSNVEIFAGVALLRAMIVCAVLQFLFRAIRKRKAAERQLETAIEALDDGFALFDSNDRLVLSNQRYHEIYKTSGDLLALGATFEEIIRGGVARGQYSGISVKDEDWISERLLAHRAGGRSIEQRLDDGRWIRVVERRTNDGGIVGFRVDITELKDATETAIAAEQAKSELIGVLSHELRAPLTIIVGYLSLMIDRRKIPVGSDLQELVVSRDSENALIGAMRLIDDMESMASKAFRSAQQLLSLINHLLDFSMIEAGKMRLDVVDVSIEEIFNDMDRSFREVIEAKGLVFDVACASGFVRADPIRVRQILTNLV